MGANVFWQTCFCEFFYVLNNSFVSENIPTENRTIKVVVTMFGYFVKPIFLLIYLPPAPIYSYITIIFSKILICIFALCKERQHPFWREPSSSCPSSMSSRRFSSSQLQCWGLMHLLTSLGRVHHSSSASKAFDPYFYYTYARTYALTLTRGLSTKVWWGDDWERRLRGV